MRGGRGRKKFPKLKKTNLSLRKEKKGPLEFVTLVSRGKGRDEKGTPISAPSIHPSIHPSTLVHWWVLVHFDFLLFTSLSCLFFFL